MDESGTDREASPHGSKRAKDDFDLASHRFTPGKCGLCDATAGTSKDHIIPYGALKRIRGADKSLVMIDTQSKKMVNHAPDGYWQRGLLCQACERKCADLDAAWFRLHDSHFQYIAADCSIAPWVIPGVDASLVTRFVISVLLRAHAATTQVFNDFSLGTATDSAMRVFRGEDPVQVGFRLAAYVAVMYGSVGRCNMPPQALIENKAVEIWLGVFRFVLFYPGVGLSPPLLSHTKHSERGGLITSRISGEVIPKYKRLLKELEMAEQAGRIRRPEIDADMQAKFDRKTLKAKRRLPVR